jgi:PAS domain S-box-containing protein
MTFGIRWLTRQSVQRKLMLAILGSSCLSMLLAGAALYFFMTFVLRQTFERDTTALTDIVAANCVGPVEFGDSKAAKDVLNSLKSHEHIVGAIVRLPNGRVFAGMGRTDLADEASRGTAEHGWMGPDYFARVKPIMVQGESVGTLVVVSNFGGISANLFMRYAQMFGVVFIAAVLLGLLLTHRARREISDPIRRLAWTAQEVAEKQDYSIRARGGAGGEVGLLADAFNHMLDRIEAGAALAREVAERRRAEAALRESEERFRSLFENATIGLYRSTEQGRLLMANPALLDMLGCESLEEASKIDVATELYVESGFREQLRERIERGGVVEGLESHWRRCDGRIITVRESAKALRDGAGKVLFYEGYVEDITARKEAEAELRRLNRELVEASRAAGMAEVATGVLHNVGNVLNSVNVSATLLHDQVGKSKFASLQQAVALMRENLPDLGAFITTDEKGRFLPDYLIKVTEHVAQEHGRWREELAGLRKNIEHMKEVVAMQQGYARLSTLPEELFAAELVEDAVRINQAGLDRHGIRVVRDFGVVPAVRADKHKALQILVNLIQNAKIALNEGPAREKRLELKIHLNGSGRVKILVKDNGVGILKENLTRIFSHGFTTRREGHGFGLHSGALAAGELGGALMAESDGLGKGATFTLELPVAGCKQ